jgi:hypothetical protein
MIERYGWVILLLGALVGGVTGWLVTPFLFPPPSAGFPTFLVVSIAVWIGLLLGYLVARWLQGDGTDGGV